jgi:LPXTG-motif cell wall-anchored protein
MCTPLGLAATLQGTIYDISLERAEDIRVNIDTTPAQFLISKDSTYSFNIPPGSYKLTAEQYDGSKLISLVEESITIQDDGTYVLDLILFPTFEEIDDDSEFIDTSTDVLIEKQNYTFIMIIGIILILIAIFLYFNKKKKPKKQAQVKKKTARKSVKKATINVEKQAPILPQDLLQLYNFIQKHKRTTQKEIRKAIPLSEAKISLMITDLESRDLIKKVKKGRGNIILLK